ncbi:MAG TPA: HEAT repeat domain-containing protein [Methylococcaceae bacterium]|nr:HEAT repeat domain-containing protein [Methylococcaceae bacterium]
MIMERGAAMANRDPTAEELEEEKRLDQEQVETAMAWLQDADTEQRAAGAEQLSAYPTPEAEERLVAALRDDLAPEVRAAAAQSLDFFDTLRENSVQALLKALEDPNEDVHLNALNTLQNQYQKLESGSVQAKKIFSGLKKKAKSPRVPQDIQKNIKEFLRDQQ